MTIENQNPAETPAPESEATAATEPVETTTPEEQEPKTFTQEELDRIIAAEKAKVERKVKRELAQQAQEAQQRPATPEAPRPDQFRTTEEYIEAVAEYKAEQKFAEREARQQRTQVDSTYAEREEAVRDKYNDFEDVAYNPDLTISTIMAEAIKESDIGPEIAYHLGKNPKEAKRIFALSPLAQAREIGKIEASLTSAPPAVKKTSSAPEPIKPVGSRSTTPKYDTTDPRSTGAMSTSEWIKAENARRAKEAR